jgi:hypothetical protein
LFPVPLPAGMASLSFFFKKKDDDEEDEAQILKPKK